MKAYLPYIQLVISILIIIFILLQQGGSSLGSAFGQEGGFYATRRGIQKKIFWATIILGVLFIATALLNLLF
ncbi:MAG: preprotein translocase subunit SecG [bacterium]